MTETTATNLKGLTEILIKHPERHQTILPVTDVQTTKPPPVHPFLIYLSKSTSIFRLAQRPPVSGVVIDSIPGSHKPFYEEN